MDHNIITLTGKDTFHGMGVIYINQPAKKLIQNRVARLKDRKNFTGSFKDGLSGLIFKSIRKFESWRVVLFKEIIINIGMHHGFIIHQKRWFFYQSS